MKVAIVGSRTVNDYDLLCDILDPIKNNITELVSGGAKGADSLAKQYMWK